MAKVVGSIFFTKFISLFLLLLHLGCFATFTSKPNHNKKRKLSPLSHLGKQPKRALSSSFSFLKRLFSSSSKPYKTNTTQTHPLSSTRSSYQSLAVLVPPEPSPSPPDNDNRTTNISSSTFFLLRNDIFPCTSCGEIFQAAHFLEHHQTTAHAVSELQDGDPGKNIVHIIFKAGWSCKNKAPQIHRVLKIHNSQKISTRFEEYREFVKSKASRSGGAVLWRDERCIADGNELLRFVCSTFACNLGVNGKSCLCNYQYCSLCGIIRFGFSPKLDGISMFSTSQRAHMSVPEDVEEEFRFMNVKRAVLVCRVVAGRIGSDDDDAELGKEGGGFDSVLGRKSGAGAGDNGVHTRLDEEELLVFNPRAVLPCFAIVYTV